MREYRKKLTGQGVTEGELLYLMDKFEQKEETTSLDLDLEIKNLFSPEQGGAFALYICREPKLWGYLLRGQGKKWQEKLMGTQDFTIDQNYGRGSFYTYLFKKGPLLYYVNNFLFLTVGLSIWNSTGVTLKCLFSIDHDKWLPEAVMTILLPSFFGMHTSWYSELTRNSASLHSPAQKIKDLLVRIAQHELVEGSEFDSAVKEFKSSYEQACLKINKIRPLNIKHDSTALDAYKNNWKTTFFGCFTSGEINNPLSNQLPTVILETIFRYL